ncbi:HlyU family transcriptional regulator [Alisedimentitalea sp. MJ-SS2]|uniref:HlyU family transcriptional regulator n=1 Tax=Aliisedimentitalea sp. MJ-SS2 TaxID=3049795 RepID=UPI002909973F|nr:HlyU family transcriptional regulator [Alisedimentitalea sp. MJ-SS2]MDU8930001.1 HlyU family transcriptional regulator [Alisedimentitalea sp. MJ-SS2]
MSLLSKLFGGKPQAQQQAEPELYKDFAIFPEPSKEAHGYRIGARIEKEVGGDLKIHQMIRADTYGGEGTAIEASLSKARQLIDEQGEKIFR